MVRVKIEPGQIWVYEGHEFLITHIDGRAVIRQLNGETGIFTYVDEDGYTDISNKWTLKKPPEVPTPPLKSFDTLIIEAIDKRLKENGHG